MSFMEQLNADMKAAMKAKNKVTLSVIRMLKSALQNETINKGSELTDDEILTVLSREVKQRKDSVKEFTNADRHDLAEQTSLELDILQDYMPEQLSEDDVKQLIDQTIQDVHAASTADMGKVMAAIMPKVKGKTDGGLVNRLVKEALSS